MRRSRGKKDRFRPKIGSLLILAAFFFFASAGYLKGKREFPSMSFLVEKPPDFIEKFEEGDLPERVVISGIGVDLPVELGKVVGDQWEIAESGVSYLVGTGLPGRAGNLVIYGHNKSNLFGPIRGLRLADQIKVVNQRGEEFIYQVKETKIVAPSEVEILMPTEEKRLTLYTCTGVFDRQRFVVVAELAQENESEL